MLIVGDDVLDLYEPYLHHECEEFLQPDVVVGDAVLCQGALVLQQEARALLPPLRAVDQNGLGRAGFLVAWARWPFVKWIGV